MMITLLCALVICFFNPCLGWHISNTSGKGGLDMGIHIRLVESVGVFALFFGEIHCNVCIFEQTAYIVSINWIKTNANTDRGIEFVTFQQKGF